MQTLILVRYSDDDDDTVIALNSHFRKLDGLLQADILQDAIGLLTEIYTEHIRDGHFLVNTNQPLPRKHRRSNREIRHT